MIVNKFSLLLAERLLKVSDVSRDTGISRTTLTALYYRRNAGIQFDTLDRLCEYFNCNIEEIIFYQEEENESIN